MERKPILVIMAAGMGSRYGGLKQMDPIDNEGHLIIDFSIYDAVLAGFKKVIFIIKKELETDFREMVGSRIGNCVEVEYVYQDINNVLDGYTVPCGRVKPWGTAHAILSCIDAINGPFAVINADDYYGRDAFQRMYDFLSASGDDEKYRYGMVGYILENTLTENGFVARGICETNEDGFLVGIHERTRIEKQGESAAFTENDGLSWTELPMNSTVSMNLWGFTESVLNELKHRFKYFLDEDVPKNPEKAEYFLPSVVGELIQEKKATVKVLKSLDRWYGVTYKEDKEMVVNAIADLKSRGVYPDRLWN